VKLHRIRIGPVRIGELGPGESRPLTEAEIQGLRKHGGSRIQHKE
jgi:16S rRNA U516 pseudouridylate synthase RsuA-like enzyme